MYLGYCDRKMKVYHISGYTGGAYKSQRKIFQCYTMGSDVNGRNAWYSNDGKKAIWWYPRYKDWQIGDREDLGSNIRRAKAHKDVYCPNKVGGYIWEYYDGNQMVDAGRGLGVGEGHRC